MARLRHLLLAYAYDPLWSLKLSTIELAGAHRDTLGPVIRRILRLLEKEG